MVRSPNRRGPLSWAAIRAVATAAAGGFGLSIDDATLRVLARGILGDDLLDDDPVASVAADEFVDRVIGWCRQPRWRLDRENLALITDPAGSTDRAGLVAELEALAETDHRLRALAEWRANAGAAGWSAERIARRWETSTSSLYRWRAALEPLPKSQPAGRADPGSPGEDEPAALEPRVRRGTFAA